MAIMTGGITVGGLATILSYANQYTKPFNEISGVVTELQNAIACGAKIFSLINQEKEIDVEESENQFRILRQVGLTLMMLIFLMCG